MSEQDLEFPQIAESILKLIKSQNNLRDLVMLEFWTPRCFTRSSSFFNVPKAP